MTAAGAVLWLPIKARCPSVRSPVIDGVRLDVENAATLASAEITTVVTTAWSSHSSQTNSNLNDCLTMWFLSISSFRSLPGRWAEYFDQRVCMSVCLSVRVSQKPNVTKFRQIFCSCYPSIRVLRVKHNTITLPYKKQKHAIAATEPSHLAR